MINLVDFLNESRGADLDKRTNDRFLGDKLNRDPEVKLSIAKTKKTLKELSSNFNSNEMDMLMQLADNQISDYHNSRSYIKFGEFKDSKVKLSSCEFTIYMSNMPKSILSQLEDKVIEKKFPKLHYSVNGNGFGITQSLFVSVYGKDFIDDNGQSDMDQFLEFIKYVLSVIKPIFKDIIDYKDDYKDGEVVNRMKWQKEQEKRAKDLAKELMK